MPYYFKIKVKDDALINGQLINKDMSIDYVSSKGNPLLNSEDKKKIADKFALLFDIKVDKIGGAFFAHLKADKQK